MRCHHCYKRQSREGYTECWTCRQTRLNRYKRLKTEGTCVYCKVDPIDTSRSVSRCSKCLEKGKDAVKERRNVKLVTGLCGNCGARPRVEGATECLLCQERRRQLRSDRKDRGLCPKCATPVDGTIMCRDCLAKETTKRMRLKLEVFRAYGGPICKCCKESDPKFLTIDHVNNDGAAHRKTFKGSIYAWLKARHYPPGFQVLCFNCNSARALWGVCPHQLS
jgi:hypothetical protein